MKNQLITICGFPCFYLLLFKNNLSLIFVNLINVCLVMSLLEFFLYGTLLSGIERKCFLSHFNEVLIKYFFRPFLFLLLLEPPITHIIVHLMVSHKSFKVFLLIFFLSFFWLDEFSLPCEFTDPFLYLSAAELLSWVFHFSYCILQLCDSCLVLSYSFYL